MEEILHQLVNVFCPIIIYSVSLCFIGTYWFPTGAGFLPSAVSHLRRPLWRMGSKLYLGALSECSREANAVLVNPVIPFGKLTKALENHHFLWVHQLLE